MAKAVDIVKVNKHKKITILLKNVKNVVTIFSHCRKNILSMQFEQTPVLLYTCLFLLWLNHFKK